MPALVGRARPGAGREIRFPTGTPKGCLPSEWSARRTATERDSDQECEEVLPDVKLMDRRQAVRSGGDRRGGAEPLLHLVMAHDTGMLHYHAAAGEDDEVGDAANVVARGELRVFFCVDL